MAGRQRVRQRLALQGFGSYPWKNMHEATSHISPCPATTPSANQSTDHPPSPLFFPARGQTSRRQNNAPAAWACAPRAAAAAWAAGRRRPPWPCASAGAPSSWRAVGRCDKGRQERVSLPFRCMAGRGVTNRPINQGSPSTKRTWSNHVFTRVCQSLWKCWFGMTLLWRTIVHPLLPVSV